MELHAPAVPTSRPALGRRSAVPASQNRGTRTARSRETGEYEDSEIMEIQGWSTHKRSADSRARVPLSAFRGRSGTTTLGATRVERIDGRERTQCGAPAHLHRAG
jgi:hypothetical protein